MMAQLLRAVPLWLWLLILVVIAGVFGWLRLEAVSAERDAAKVELQRTRGVVAALQSALDYRRAAAKRLDAALTARDQAIAEANNEIQAKRSELAELERNDAETRNWAAEPVPNATADWVRRLVDADSDRAGGGDTHDTSTPDGATARTASADRE